MNAQPTATSDPAPRDDAWQALPPRARRMLMIRHALGFAIPAAGLGVAGGVLSSAWFDMGLRALAASVPLALLLGVAFGAWLGAKKYRHTAWKLDAHGFAVRRGRLWRLESRVPVSRVQHLDLKRGPLERAFTLASLVVHTAGTRMATVSLSGLDDGDAERLRDRLARQLDEDDAL